MVASKPANEPPFATQVSPLSIEYSSGAVPPDAVIVIVPSKAPQSVGSLEETFVILGALGTVKMTGLFAYNTSQEPSVFLTDMLNVPAPKLLKIFDTCQLMPPSIEYSNVVPVAVIVIVPSFVPQLLGLTGATFVIIG